MFVILVIALLIFLLPWKIWSRLFSDMVPTKTKGSALNQSAKVWVGMRSGFYYCSESSLFGKLTPGLYMTQGEAVQKGYRPADTQPCQEREGRDVH